MIPAGNAGEMRLSESAERPRPLVAVVSTGIRRDLLAPMRYFSRLRIAHFYRQASYGDLTPADLDPSLSAYHNPCQLYHKLVGLRPDAVQSVEPFSVRLLPYTYAVWAASRRLDIPLVVVTLENRPLAQRYGRTLSRMLQGLLRPVFHRAQGIICLNEGSRRNVLTVGPYEPKLQRLMYGAWGVDLEEFSPMRDGREPQWGPGPVLLFVGRLHREKGIFDLLQAFALIRERISDAKMIFIGDGPERVSLEREVAAREWSSAVTLLGTLKNRDLPPYLRAATVLVAPSVTTRKWEEQVGMASLQAMACGLPVVTTRSGAIPEYVPEAAGMLVPEQSPMALADAILHLLAHPSIGSAMGQAGRQYCLENYDARRNVQRAEETLLALLRQAPRG